MRRTALTLRPLSLALLASVGLAACQEKQAAPADCPDLCPGNIDVRDTVITPVLGSDSAFEGYVQPGLGGSLRVSWQYPLSEDRAVVRFVQRPDSFTIGDSLYPYTIDSVSLAFSVLARDSSVKGLIIYLYRMPATVDPPLPLLLPRPSKAGSCRRRSNRMSRLRTKSNWTAF